MDLFQSHDLDRGFKRLNQVIFLPLFLVDFFLFFNTWLIENREL